MMKRLYVFLLFIAACACSASAGWSGPGVTPGGLTCEYRKDPVGIDSLAPRLSWKLEAGNPKTQRGIRQTAYRILVARSEKLLREGQADLWDSGKVESDQSIHVEYKGKPLESGKKCFWKVRTWTTAGEASSQPACWTMGILKAEDWKCRWIRPDYSQGLSTSGVESARWIWYPEGAPAEAVPAEARYFRRTLKIPERSEIKSAEIALLVDNAFELWVNGNAAGNGGNYSTETRVDIKKYLHKGDNVLALKASNTGGGPNPAGLVGCVEVRFSDDSVLEDRTDKTWLVAKAVAEKWETAGLETGAWTNSMELGGFYSGPWNPARRSSGGRTAAHELRTGLIRKSFDLPAVPASATVAMNIAGYAELYINGKKVGTDVLTPAVSDQNIQTFYVTYDVAPFLKKGRNVMGVSLGRGWAHGVPAVRLQLDASVAGKSVTIGTVADWKGTEGNREWIGGRHWNDFGGESVDARREIPLWNERSVDDTKWPNVMEVDGPKGAPVAQGAPLNRIGARIPAVSVRDLGSNRYEIDFGTCLAGWLRLKMPKLSAGTTVKMKFADANVNGKYQDFNQRSEFISAGGDGEVFENKFNYAGFRYVVVEGLPAPPAREDAMAMLVESDLETVGSFECSNDLFNRIHRLTQWTQRCLNLGGYYVDCPHRERLGYGDGQVAAEGFMTNYRADAYYRHWLRGWRLRQEGNGKLPHVAPFGQGGGGPGWPGLLSAMTWRHFLYYGDRRVLEENYEAIRRYVDYLESICKDNVMRKFGGQWDFIGDWVAPDRGMDTGNWPGKDAAEFFNNCYRVYQMDLLTKMASVLGRSDDAARYNETLAKIRPVIHGAFYDAANKRYVVDEQSYYVMPLMTGVTPEAERTAVFANLENNIMEKRKGHLDTGMLGTYFMMEYLRQSGRNDLVFTMFSQTNHPGWGHMLAGGATTCWEQWNGYWSRIHSCFTGADNWLYQGPGGIRPDPTGPGFQKIIIRPAIVGDLKWAKASHDSPYGLVVNNWQLDGTSVTMEVVVPPNTMATVYVPAGDEKGVTESGKPASKAACVKFLRMENGTAVYEVGSGSYKFSSNFNTGKDKMDIVATTQGLKVGNGRIAVDVTKVNGSVDVIFTAMNAAGKWEEVCRSFRPDFASNKNGNRFFDTTVTPCRYQVSEMVRDYTLESSGPDYAVVCLKGSNGNVAVEERISLRKDDAFAGIAVTAVLDKPELDYLMHSFIFNLDRKPGFVHSPSAKLDDGRSGPARDQVIGDHAFHSPAVILQDGGLFAAMAPDLASLNENRMMSPDARRTQRVQRNVFSVPIEDDKYTMPSALDLNISSGLTGKPVFSYGMMDFVVGHHVRYQRQNDSAMVRRLSGKTVRFAFDLFVGADVKECRGYQQVARHQWKKYGHPLFLKSELPLSYDEYVRTVYGVVSKPMDPAVQAPVKGFADNGAFLDFDMNGQAVGGMVSPLGVLGFGDALWNSEFWNNARDASGMFYWGTKLKNKQMVDRAKMAINLCLNSPRNDAGFFSLVYLAGSGKWQTSTIGPSPHPQQIFARDNTVYDIPAMSKTAAHMMEYYRECEKDGRIIDYLKPYADRLINIIDERGILPSYFTPDMKPIEDLKFSAQPAASMWFLAEYGLVTGKREYTDGAKRIAAFLMKEILPEQLWIDLEPYYSCGRNSLALLHDTEQGLPVRGNLSTFWAARGFASLYLATNDKAYLDAGEAVVDYVSFSQACWAPHYVYTAFPFGGFTADNIDTATWLDARQCEMVAPFMWYGKKLARQDLVERGVAAARASVVLINHPLHKEKGIYRHTNKYGFGLGPENINHEGHNQSAMRTHPGWGECSGIFTGLADADRYGTIVGGTDT